MKFLLALFFVVPAWAAPTEPEWLGLGMVEGYLTHKDQVRPIDLPESTCRYFIHHVTADEVEISVSISRRISGRPGDDYVHLYSVYVNDEIPLDLKALTSTKPWQQRSNSQMSTTYVEAGKVTAVSRVWVNQEQQRETVLDIDIDPTGHSIRRLTLTESLIGPAKAEKVTARLICMDLMS